MGKTIHFDGIDSKEDVIVTGSISTTVAPIFPSITTTGNVQGADLIATDDLFAQGMNSSTTLNDYPVVVNTSTGQLYYSSNGSIGDNIARAVNGSDPLILRYDSSPTLHELNGGTLIYMPQDNDQSIRFGFAQGTSGGSSWNKDYNATIINVGTNGSSNNGWSMGISVTTPNDGGGNFIIFVTGRQPDGTARFQYSAIAPGNAFTSIYDIQTGGTLRLAMDYDNRTIVINSDAFA